MRRRGKKNDKSGTKEGLEKNQNFGHNGARENRPLTPTKRALRAALWTTGTSGKVLFDGRLTTYAII
jgi:hypothetical protein